MGPHCSAARSDQISINSINIGYCEMLEAVNERASAVAAVGLKERFALLIQLFEFEQFITLML